MIQDFILLSPWSKKLSNGYRNPKNYPFWKKVVDKFPQYYWIQLGVSGEEQVVPDFRCNLPLAEIKLLIRKCRVWLSGDNFFQHLAWSEQVRGIVVFVQSDPLIFGHTENINILKNRSYLRPNQFNLWTEALYRSDAFVSHDIVVKEISKFLQKEP